MANPIGGTTYIVIIQPGVGANLGHVFALLQSYGTWAKITDNSWAIVAIGEKSPAIRNKLKPFIGVGGRLFVIKSGYESAWENPHSSGDWLKKYLQN